MKKLIHIDDNRGELHCDNPQCRHVLPNAFVEWGRHLIGMPCPKCGENLLTERDYHDSERMLARIAWVNKWFGWLGRESAPAEGEGHTIGIRNHAGKVIIDRE